MRNFNYFENGGPAPSACLSCGANKRLFDLGREIPVAGGMAQVCFTCVSELATFIGYAEKAPLQAEITKSALTIATLEDQLAAVPNQVEGLINGIRGNVADFIFAVSYSDSADQPEVVSDTEGLVTDVSADNSKPAGQRKASSKSISE